MSARFVSVVAWGAGLSLATAVGLLSGALVSAGDARSACELLSAASIRSITGRAVHIDPSSPPRHDARRDVCRYVADGTTFTFSMVSLGTERAARSAFASEVARAFDAGAPNAPLRGLGVQARFQGSKAAVGGTIVARHGSMVFVLAGHADQEVLVALARSVVAQLERPRAQ